MRLSRLPSCRFFHGRRGGVAAGPRAAFTLLEMMVSLAIFSILAVVLVSFTSQAGNILRLSQSQNDYRMHARAVLDYMGDELRCASLAQNWSQQVTGLGKPTLEFLVSPQANTDNFPDSIFWQAPIATDDLSRGVMAEVGYFIHWDGNQSNLCRFFVNPTDTANYLVYTDTRGGWAVSGTGPGNLQAVAPADAAGNYQGLFLENVLGLWVQPYKVSGGTATLCSKPYDSSDAANAPHPLPTYLTISIVVLEPGRAVRLQHDSAGVVKIKALVANAPDAATFVASPGLPTEVQNGLTVASIKVSLDNYR